MGYGALSSFTMMRMIAKTSRPRMTLPERGGPEKTFGPKYPNNIQRLVLLSSYKKASPAASIGRGVLISAAWGRGRRVSNIDPPSSSQRGILSSTAWLLSNSDTGNPDSSIRV
jgi:hypothetical protein